MEAAAAPVAAEAPTRAGRDARAVLLSVVSNFGVMLVNASTGILTARALQPAGRGALAAMNLWPTFLAFTTTLGIPSAMVYMLRRHPQDGATHVSAGLFLSAALGFVAAAGGSFFLPFWLGHQYSAAVIHAAQIFLLTVPMLSTILAARSIFEAHGLFSISNKIQMLNPAVTLGGLLVLLLGGRLTPIAAAACYTGAALPTFAYTLAKLWPFLGQRVRPGMKACRVLLHYGVRSYGVDLLGTLALQIDQVLVISMLHAAQMGVYGVLLSLSRMFNLFGAAIVMVLFPKASGANREEVRTMVGRAARAGVAITACTSLIVSLVGRPVLALLYGAGFAGNARCLRILLVEVTLSTGVYILAQAFMALGRPGILSTLQAIGLGLNVPLLLVLVPRFGITGAAASLLLSTIARLCFVLGGFPLLLRMRVPSLRPDAGDLRVLRALLPRTGNG